MKTIFYFGTILLAVQLSATAQTNAPATAGAEAISTNAFPDADVVMLLDETKVDVAADGSFQATRHVRSKIMSARGRKIAEVVIPFNDKYQEVDVHFAKATLPDGTEMSVKPEDMETLSAYPGYPAYGGAKTVQYRVPGGEIGAIIDQEYVLKVKPVMRDQFWMVWRPRGAQPAMQMQLSIRMPSTMKFQWRGHHLDVQPQITESPDKQWKTCVWSYSAPTQVKAEPYMPSPEECFPWVEVSTVDSWNDLAQWLDSLCQGQVDSNPDMEDHVRALTSTAPTAAAKIAAVYYWIEDNFHFVPVELGLSGYKPRPATQTFQGRYGDAKDMSALLAAMLGDAGIKARLAFLESGSARIISDRLPMARQLTHCIVVVEADGRKYYLDPSAETAKYDVVLGRLCNTELLVLGKGENKLVAGPEYDGSKHGTREELKIELASDGSVKGEVRTEYLGESDAFLRAAVKYARPGEMRNLFEQEVRKNMPHGRLTDYEVGDAGARERNFATMYRFDAPSWATVARDTISFRPQLSQQVPSNDDDFGKGDRQFPILFYETAPSSVQMDVTIPDGFKVAKLPKDLEFSNAFSYWKRTMRENGNHIVITEMSHLKTVELPKESVVEIHKYFQEAIALKSEPLVLQKR